MTDRRWFYPHAEVLHIVDGDTIDVDIIWDVGFERRAGQKQRLRFARIDTPETNRREQKEAGDAAEAYVRSLLHERSDPDELTGLSQIGSIIAFESYKDDGLSRYVADIWLDPTDIGTDDTLNDHLVDAGHAIYKTYGDMEGQPRAESPWHMTDDQLIELRQFLGIPQPERAP